MLRFVYNNITFQYFHQNQVFKVINFGFMYINKVSHFIYNSIIQFKYVIHDFYLSS